MSDAMSDAPQPRFCVDCRFARSVFDPPQPYGWDCTHPASVRSARYDIVTGAKLPAEPLDCRSARSGSLTGNCGPQGRYWQARE